jgi:PAS domain S-box-containing protein
MKANTALGFLLAGLALFFLREEKATPTRRAFGLGCAIAVLALGAMTIGEHAFGWRFGFDEWLRHDSAPPFAGRTSPLAAVNLILIGLALIFLSAEMIWPLQACAFAASLIGLVALTRSLQPAAAAARLHAYPAEALHTVLGFLLLAVGLQCARPNRGWMATTNPERAGSSMALRLLFAAAVVPIVLGSLRGRWQESGGFGTELGIALFTIVSVGIFTALIWFNAHTLNAVQEKVLHRERLYVVLSQCNQSIVHIADRDALFARICEIAVDLGKFRMAWIGLADYAEQRVRPVACRGADDGFLEQAVFSLRDEPAGQMPAAVAIREGRAVVANRVESDPRMATLRTEALRRSYRSAAAFPLRNNGDIIGCFVLYAEVPDFFNKEEVDLLQEVAGDVSFALKQMKIEAQRRQIEEDRTRLDRELRLIFDSVPAMIFYKDRQHRLVRANATMVRTLGRPAEELIGKTDAELGTPYAEQYARDEDEIAATGQPKLGFIEPLMTPTGERWLQTDKVPLRDDAGNITGFIALAIDITERKRMEDALQASEAEFRASFFSTAVGQVQADPVSGRYLRVNPKFCEITGYTEEELLGMTFYELTHPADRAADTTAHRKMTGGEMKELAREKRYLRKDGRPVWVSINASLIRDEEGRPLRTLAVIQDITERKRSDAARLAAEAKFQRLVEQSLTGIYVIQDDRFVYANPKMEEILGFTAQELAAAPVLDFIAPEDRPLVHKNIQKRMEGMVEDVHYELRMLRKDGAVIHVEAHGGRAEYNGRPAILGSLLDVSDRKTLEEKLLQSQKIEAIGQLAGGIAHDFNNLLTAILGNVRLAMDDLAEGHPACESVQEIEIASTRAVDLVRRILTFSRQQPAEREAVALRVIVEEALKLLRATLPASIEIRANFAGSPTVLADATQIHQVIMNLGTNASHAMKGKGVIEVGINTVEFTAEEARASAELNEGRYVRLSVSDDGCGMEPATIARIFEPFFTTKPLGEGTGLGLSMVHGIMKNHDGAITVYSQPDKGTVFHLYFPVHGGTIKQVPLTERQAVRGSGEHILFVDDEEQLVVLASEMLKRLGYRVSAFNRPRKALAAFKADPNSFDLVVSDLSMPEMIGPELAQEILRIRPDMPIVIATGYIRPEDTEKVHAVGVKALVLKPNTIEEMAPMFHRILAEAGMAKREEIPSKIA